MNTHHWKTLGPFLSRELHFTLKIQNKPTEHQKDHRRQTTGFWGKKKWRQHITSTMYTHTPWKVYICSIYISKYTRAAHVAGWENRNTSWEGHEGKKKTTEENKELFTFNNSVAFNTSIYKQALFMYRLRWEPSEVIPNTKEKYKTPW